MIAIRGATTVNSDTAEEIRNNVKELLNEIVTRNSLSENEIICILFSNTSDIRSFYPAKAAREAGFFNCALYSSAEPEIHGSLEKCIRVMILAEKNIKPEHIYLNNAKNLRKDLTKILNIAIDGPAGSGKSTIAKILSKRFKILYLDTGAMYRAFALACIKNNVDVADSKKVESIIDKINISIEYKDGEQKTLLDGYDVTAEIRTPEMSMLASKVSAQECVRTKLVGLQREIAAKNSCVLDGRDIGTNVLPASEHKFFLTATPEIRAERRNKENNAKGIIQPFKEVLKEIQLRDRQDITRKIAPLRKAEDAIEIDTSLMSVEEVADYITEKIQGKI